MHGAIEKVLFSEADIRARLDELGAMITEDLRGEKVSAVVILHGGIIFTADLLRRVQIPLTIDSLSVRSYYGGTESSGEVSFGEGALPDVEGRHVLLIDDILDTGRTLAAVKRKLLEEMGATAVSCAVMLAKDKKRADEVDVEYVGFEMADEFVVGYGLDYQERYRNLPFIGVLDPTHADA
ncbi:hypoxanthine phosphoribosyltransferase [Sulfuriroseicoccus oceanibius]|uniref:Hypoxanthine phosphoribosyltransferase n=1 Tax=Sulfuriroseicoccus oceanibius TaxID=2707525 RepID=A0A6B3LCN4_9BACT|nr:hypoxanthine phosphoribosyltransferase [Sulfuriroseicoccus oceanibius]QQL44687.1 hypoxanthine phosphoribosyltransferase [Sulfuriroseicoccus oceanibius]